MPGPGPHTMYALGAGAGLMRLTRGGFSPHHALVYAANAFLGPDLGSFAEWLTSAALRLGQGFGSFAMDVLHDPFYYPLLLGLPLSFFYAWLSGVLLRRGVLDAGVAAVPLSRKQCFLLISAGSLSHFFLDHLFEENGHSSMYTWILSTGWWKSSAPINPDAVIVVGILCACLFLGFIYINRLKQGTSFLTRSNRSLRFVMIIAFLYCIWCSFQIYWRNPPRPAVGEEADLGVLVFMGLYFFLPHALCILSVNQKDHHELSDSDHLPL